MRLCEGCRHGEMVLDYLGGPVLTQGPCEREQGVKVTQAKWG